MKTIICSVICRVIVIIAVLSFVFGVVWLTNNTKFLWLLFLIFSAEFIPTYEIKPIKEQNNV